MAEHFDSTKAGETKPQTPAHHMGHQDGFRECYLPNQPVANLPIYEIDNSLVRVDNIYDVGPKETHFLAERVRTIEGGIPDYWVFDGDKTYLDLTGVVKEFSHPNQNVDNSLRDFERGTDIYSQVEAVSTQINSQFRQGMPRCDEHLGS